MPEIRVSVAYAGPAWCGEYLIRMPQGATVADAIAASAIGAQVPAGELAAAACGVWGKTRPRDYALRDGDRVELYRPLRADPKDARRAKAATGKRG